MAALLGAEEYGFATAPLIALGCIMMRKCHLNTCPVGIASQDEELRKKFTGQPSYVMNFFYFLANEIRNEMAKLGFESMSEIIGMSNYLKINPDKCHAKAKNIDLTPLLINNKNEYNTIKVPYKDNGLDPELIGHCYDAIYNNKQVTLNDVQILNKNRTVGATLSHEIAKKYGENGLKEDNKIVINLKGNGGQSFGMCLIKGVTLNLEGDSNDYVGKSLSGGIISIFPNNNTIIKKEAYDNIIIGNACLYGATSGKAFFSGVAGERFAVRNSGVISVVEGVGNHGCEYMTGGRVIVLGKIGTNFAAGMSGGIAYLLNNDYVDDIEYNVSHNINKQTINEQRLNDDDKAFVKDILQQHVKYTDSERAKMILENYDDEYNQMFTKIMPIDYEKVLIKAQQQAKVN